MGDFKVSFGFSKVKKANSLLPNRKDEKSAIQYISSIENNKLKLTNEEDEPKLKKALVIPLKGSDNAVSTALKSKSSKNISENDTKTEPTSDDKLEALAVKELLEGEMIKPEEKLVYSVPLSDSQRNKESTLDDYDDVPVSEFGLAMLRGMGWAPGKGIGKKKQVVNVTAPSLRPKGVGLGADKPKSAVNTTNDLKKNEELLLKKGSYVRIISGTNRGSYGQVDGFCDQSGRVFVKLSVGNKVISVTEITLKTVTKEEYNKNSKVINIEKYDKYNSNHHRK